jgi:predicted small integral membrane protein
MITRYTNISLVLILGAFSTLVAVNNLTDYNSNFEFVKHVLSMDTTFPGNNAMYRAIHVEWAWHLAYALIIAGEIITATLLCRGGIALWKSRHAAANDFNRAKRTAVAGLATGFIVWFFGFTVIGGEWFLMWQSSKWNGLEAASRVYLAMLVCLVYLNQYETEK